MPFLNKYPIPAPVINTSISLLATPKNTLAIPATMPTLAITLAILALSIKFNLGHFDFLSFLGFSFNSLELQSEHTPYVFTRSSWLESHIISKIIYVDI